MVWIPLVTIAAEHIDFKWRATMLTTASAGACFFVFIDGVLSSYFLINYHWRDLWLLVALISLVSAIICWLSLKWVNAWGHQLVREHRPKKSYDELFQWLKTKSGITVFFLFGVIGLSFPAFQTYLAPFVREEHLLNLNTTAVMWSVMGISGIFGGIGIGIITDRFSVKASLIAVFIMSFIAALMVCIPINTPRILIMAVLFGIAQAAIYGLGPAYMSKVLSSETAASAFSSATLVMVITTLIGNFTGGWSQGFLGSFWWLFMGLAGLFLFGAILSFGLKKEINSPHQTICPDQSA